MFYRYDGSRGSRPRLAPTGNLLPILVLFVGGFASCVGCSVALNATTADTVRDRAETDARAYAVQMHPGMTRVLCQGVDSDGDGYVTCTLGDGREAVGIECRASLWMDYARGCRPMRAAVRVAGGAGGTP